MHVCMCILSIYFCISRETKANKKRSSYSRNSHVHSIFSSLIIHNPLGRADMWKKKRNVFWCWNASNFQILRKSVYPFFSLTNINRFDLLSHTHLRGRLSWSAGNAGVDDQLLADTCQICFWFIKRLRAGVK